MLFPHLPDDLRCKILDPCIDKARDDLWNAKENLLAIEFLHQDRAMTCSCVQDDARIVKEKQQILDFLLEQKKSC